MFIDWKRSVKVDRHTCQQNRSDNFNNSICLPKVTKGVQLMVVKMLILVSVVKMLILVSAVIHATPGILT